MRIRATGSTMKRGGGGGGGCDGDCVTALIKMGRATVGMPKKKDIGKQETDNCGRDTEVGLGGRWCPHQKAARPFRLAQLKTHT